MNKFITGLFENIGMTLLWVLAIPMLVYVGFYLFIILAYLGIIPLS